METGSTPARWDRKKDCPRTWLWTIHRRADNCAGSPRGPRRVSRSRKWNGLKPGPATGRDRARCARSCHPVAAARAAAGAAVDIPAAAGGGGPCASTATHNTLAIALAQQSSFHHRNNPILVRTGQEAWPTGASRVPHTRGPHRTRIPAPNNKGTHTHTHRHTDTNTGWHTDTGSHSRNTPRWAVWCGLAHHMAARNRLDSPSGTLAAPPRWRPQRELPPGTSESAPDKAGSGGPASPALRRFQLERPRRRQSPRLCPNPLPRRSSRQSR